MTDPSPLPPPETPTTRCFDIAPIMFGQEWEDMDGTIIYAEQDSVRIRALNPDGTTICSILQTPEAAIALALTIQDAAVRAIKAAVDDQGRAPTVGERFRRINAAYTKARS